MIRIVEPVFSEEEKEAVLEIIESHQITRGKWTKRFQEEFAEFVGVEHCFTVCSGTVALFIALRAYMSRVLSGAMIVGKVELIPSTRTGQDIGYGISAPFNVVTARLNYYLLARDNQGLRIVASGSVSAQGRGPHIDDAGYRAMEALAKRLGADIMGKLERYMASKRKVVTVVVSGVRSTRQNFAIKEKLQRVPWVQSVEDMGLGRFRVSYLENTVYLANAIERMPGLQLIRFSPTEVEARLL